MANASVNAKNIQALADALKGARSELSNRIVAERQMLSKLTAIQAEVDGLRAQVNMLAVRILTGGPTEG